MTRTSIYRRPLPEGLVPFASEDGRRLFREALAAGTMEGYFALSEQFHTQADPAYCGLGSLVMVLNALAIDPGRLWKGPWRWFSEELLDCCKPLDRVRESGISLDELACLGTCNGADARVERASLEKLREDIQRAAAAPREPIVVVSYDRKLLGQTGGGHFSPVGGYHPDLDLVLLLDVARFKYPPHWVSLERLHAAMAPRDSATGEPRGWVVFTPRLAAGAVVFSLAVDNGVDALVTALATTIPENDPPSALKAFAAAVEGVGVSLIARDAAAPEHAEVARTVHAELRATETFGLVGGSEVLAVLALATTTWQGPELRAMFARDLASPALAAEIERVRTQVEALCRLRAKRCCV